MNNTNIYEKEIESMFLKKFCFLMELHVCQAELQMQDVKNVVVHNLSVCHVYSTFMLTILVNDVH